MESCPPSNRIKPSLQSIPYFEAQSFFDCIDTPKKNPTAWVAFTPPQPWGDEFQRISTNIRINPLDNPSLNSYKLQRLDTKFDVIYHRKKNNTLKKPTPALSIKYDSEFSSTIYSPIDSTTQCIKTWSFENNRYVENTKKLHGKTEKHAWPVPTDLSLKSDSSLGAISMDNGSVSIFQITNLTPVKIISEPIAVESAHKSSCTSCEFINSNLFTGGFDTHVKSWDIKSGQRKSIYSGYHRGPITNIIRDGTKRFLSTSTDSMAILWDIETGIPCGKFFQHKMLEKSFFRDEHITSACFTGTHWLLGSQFGILYIWDMKSYSTNTIIQIESIKGLPINKIIRIDDNNYIILSNKGKFVMFDSRNNSHSTWSIYCGDLTCGAFLGSSILVGNSVGDIWTFPYPFLGQTPLSFSGAECEPIIGLSKAKDCFIALTRSGNLLKFSFDPEDFKRTTRFEKI